MSWGSFVRVLAGVRFRLHPVTLNLLVCAGLIIFYNDTFWRLVGAGWPGRDVRDYLFMGSLGLTVGTAFFLLLQGVAFRHVLKPVLVCVVMIAAAASYYSATLGVVFDKAMIANIVGTDVAEVGDLLSLPLFVHIFLMGVLPSIFILKVDLVRKPLRRELVLRSGAVLGSIALIALTGALFYQDYASFVRNNRHIRYAIIPSSPVYYSFSYLSDVSSVATTAIAFEDIDARPGDVLTSGEKPLVLVLVLGETARAENFSLDGYERQTNPRLARLPVQNFANVTSCGTSTAESVPCLFSPLGRGEASALEMSHSANLLDYFGKAGFDTVWIENNSGGCKGVCRPARTIAAASDDDRDLCSEGTCFDEVLVRRLKDELDQVSRNTLFLLHQMGSHGPAYYKRYPPEFRIFEPACETSQLQECSREEIVNAYDNSIAYTDSVLADIVSLLSSHEDRFDPVFLYVSDHGESLGEMGMYLHGMPYGFSPYTQRHVPMVFWSADTFNERTGLKRECVNRHRADELSHDNLFHTVVGLAEIRSKDYDPALDFLAACRMDESDAVIAVSHTDGHV